MAGLPSEERQQPPEEAFAAYQQWRTGGSPAAPQATAPTSLRGEVTAGDYVDTLQSGVWSGLAGYAEVLGMDTARDWLKEQSDNNLKEMSEAARVSLGKDIVESTGEGLLDLGWGEGATDIDTIGLKTAMTAGQMLDMLVPGGFAAKGLKYGLGVTKRAKQIKQASQALAAGSAKALSRRQAMQMAEKQLAGRTMAANTLAYGAAETGVSAGNIAMDARERILNTPLEALATSEPFKEAYWGLMDSNPEMTHDQAIELAKEAVAEEGAKQALNDVAVTTFLAGAVAGNIYGKMLRFGSSSVGKAALKGGITETLQEALQSYAEEYYTAKAQQTYADPTIDPTANAPAAAAEGALLGGGIGAAMGAPTGLYGDRPAKPRTEPPPDEVTPPPDRVPDAPSPEPESNVIAQMNAFTEGRKRAVLITPGTLMPEMPENTRVALVKGKGRLIYREGDTEVLDAIKNGDLGKILGYGISQKPEQPTGEVVTARDAEDRVIQDVVTDGSQEVLDAAEHVAGPDREVTVRPAEQAIEERESRRAAEVQGPQSLYGMSLKLENLKGSQRSGVSPQGEPWSQTLGTDYGYLEGTTGVDGSPIDVLVVGPETNQVYVIDQVDPATGEFDEHKVVSGVNSAQEAKQAYLSNYEKGWKGFGGIVAMSPAGFEIWATDERRTSRPATRRLRKTLRNATRRVVVEGDLAKDRRAQEAAAYAQRELQIRREKDAQQALTDKAVARRVEEAEQEAMDRAAQRDAIGTPPPNSAMADAFRAAQQQKAKPKPAPAPSQEQSPSPVEAPPAPTTSAKFMFLGEKSQTASEIPEDEWFVGAEGKRRYETDDSEADFLDDMFDMMEEGETVPLLSLFYHPELVEAYPDITQVQVKKQELHHDFAGTIDGAFDGKNKITISPMATDPFATLLHELQHWVQNKEDFARGGNRESAIRALPADQQQELFDRALEKERAVADLYQAAMDIVNEKRDAFPEYQRYLNANEDYLAEMEDEGARGPANSFYAELVEAENAAKRAMFGTEFTLTELQRGTPEFVAADALFSVTPGRDIAYIEQRAEEAERLIGPLEQGDIGSLVAVIGASGEAYELYLNLAGEGEARTVEQRMDLTYDERRDTPVRESELEVGYDRDNAIVTFENPADIQRQETAAEQQARTARANGVQRIVDEVTEGWANAPEIIVVDDLNDPRVPQEVRDYHQTLTARQKQEGGRVPGFYYQGRVYVNAADVTSRQDVAQTLFHEALLHFGFEQVFGPDIVLITQAIVDNNREVVEKKARQYGLDVNDQMSMRKAAEEVLAEMAETHPNSTIITRLVNLIRDLLRKIPAFRNMEFSRSELLEKFVLPAQGFVERGNPEAPGMVNSAIPKLPQDRGVVPATDTQETPKASATQDILFRRVSPTAKEEFKRRSQHARETVRRFWKRNFTSGGLLNAVNDVVGANEDTPMDMFVQSDNIKQVGEEETTFYLHNFRKAVVAAFDAKSYNRVSEEDRARINDYLTAADEDKAGIAAGLPRGVVEAADVLRAQLDNLSDRIVGAIAELIDIEIDKLTPEKQDYVNQALAQGLADSRVPSRIRNLLALSDIIISHKGRYMHRSYEAYDNPNRGRDVRELDPDLWERGKQFFKRQELESIARSVIGSRTTDRETVISQAADYLETFVRGDRLTDSQIAALDARHTDVPTDENLEGFIEAFFQSTADANPFEHQILQGQMAGSKDTSMLKRRKDVPPILRELLGEYTDPVVNFAKSSAKMQWFLGNHYFLTQMYEKGNGVFMFPDKGHPGFTAKIAGNNSQTMDPLNGMYTSPDLITGMSDIRDVNEYVGFWRGYLRMNSWVKYGKTILSPTTQLRNFWSAAMFTVMNGHMASLTRLSKARKAAISDLFTKDESWLNYLRHLISLGVLHDNPYAGELKDALKDAMESDAYAPGIRGRLRRGAKWVQSAYQVGDDFWKIVGFESEKARQMDHGLSEAEAEKRAAYLIRNGYPTYSLVPRAIKGLRRFPLVGTFVSFPAEIVRTTKNQFKFIQEEWARGNRDLAVKRAMGLATASSITGALSMMSAAMMGFDEDDDERLRLMVPEWSRNSQLLHWAYDKDGLPQYLDMSFMDPYAYLKKPLIALFNDNYVTATDRMAAALKEALSPFFGPDIASGALGELVFNQKLSGGQVWNPEDPANRIAADILNHFRKATQPGIFSNVERMMMALQGEHSRTGRKFDTRDEMLALAGFRFSAVNIPQSLRYHGYGFTDSLRNATRILSYTAGDQGKVTDRELKAAVKRTLYSRKRAFDLMSRRVEAARALGVPDTKIVAALRSSNVSKKDIQAVMEGEVRPWTMSQQFIKTSTQGALVATPNAQRRAEIVRDAEHRKKVIQEEMRKQQ